MQLGRQRGCIRSGCGFRIRTRCAARLGFASKPQLGDGVAQAGIVAYDAQMALVERLQGGAAEYVWRPSEKMSVSTEGLSDGLWNGSVWNACPSAMVRAASLAVTTHSAQGVAGEAVGSGASRVQAVSPKARAAAGRFCRWGWFGMPPCRW